MISVAEAREAIQATMPDFEAESVAVAACCGRVLRLLWTGDTLMSLEKYEALKMMPKSIDGKQYLFIEVGGFSPRHQPGWKTAWNVMERQ